MFAEADEHVLLERGDSLVVLELVAAVVFLGAPAEDFDDQRGIGDRVLIFGIARARSADDGDVRLGGEASLEHADAAACSGVSPRRAQQFSAACLVDGLRHGDALESLAEGVAKRAEFRRP